MSDRPTAICPSYRVPGEDGWTKEQPIDVVIERIENGGLYPIHATHRDYVNVNADPRSTSAERERAARAYEANVRMFGNFFEHVERLIAEYRKEVAAREKIISG